MVGRSMAQSLTASSQEAVRKESRLRSCSGAQDGVGRWRKESSRGGTGVLAVSVEAFGRSQT